MDNKKATVDQSYQTLFVIWSALLGSQFLFVVLVWFIKPELFKFTFAQPLLGKDPMIVAICAVLAISALAASVVLPGKHIAEGIGKRDVGPILTGLIIGCALSESVSLFGLFLAISLDYQYFFVFSILGIVGTLLNFPKRKDVEAASMERTF